MLIFLSIMFCSVAEQEAILSVEHFTGKCLGSVWCGGS